jgi:hypothetical protein
MGNLCNDKIEKMMQEVLTGFNFAVASNAVTSLLND